MLKNNVSLSGSSYQIQTSAIYYQDGYYWVAYDPEWLSTENAADPNFNIEDLRISINPFFNANHDLWKIGYIPTPSPPQKKEEYPLFLDVFFLIYTLF
ncbi:MAG: hypothetical protein ALMCE001_18660 [Methanocorpusculum sp. MCE]|nr:MAG: hypothetical protein ALMCE001_18660 [Methanocorpusculum sp. MCE]